MTKHVTCVCGHVNKFRVTNLNTWQKGRCAACLTTFEYYTGTFPLPKSPLANSRSTERKFRLAPATIIDPTVEGIRHDMINLLQTKGLEYKPKMGELSYIDGNHGRSERVMRLMVEQVRSRMRLQTRSKSKPKRLQSNPIVEAG